MASTRADALVLGGGFAGLACATALAEKGARVVLLEKKPHLGGRAFSFKDPELGVVVDNGQHLFMGCYAETLRFLERIGSAGLLRFEDDVRVDFADAEGARDRLSCPPILGSPAHFALGVLRLKGLTLGEKAKLLRLDSALREMKKKGIPPELDLMTVRQWLDSLGQSRNIQRRLFDPIALGALNDDPAVAAATGLAQVLLAIFFRRYADSRFGLSTVGLSELYTEQAQAYVELRGGQVLMSKRVHALKREGSRVTGALLENGEPLEAAATVSTLPPWDLARLGLGGEWQKLKPSPIVSVSLKLDRRVVDEPFVGMIGTETQWVFNKSRILSLDGGGQYVSLVISGAHRHVQRDPRELLAQAQADLARCFPSFRDAKVLAAKVVKEPYATLSPVPGSDAVRPAANSGPEGFYFAGDWTQTRLPATIESACLSGHVAADFVTGTRLR